MPSPALWLQLAEVLNFLGLAGVFIAVTSAVAAAVAFGVGAPSAGGIATAGWLMGVVLSLCGGFAANWSLLALAVGALPAASLLAVVTALLRAGLSRPSQRAHVSHVLAAVEERARTQRSV